MDTALVNKYLTNFNRVLFNLIEMKTILAIIVLNLVILVNDIAIQNIEYKNCGWMENRIPRCKLDGLFISTCQI